MNKIFEEIDKFIKSPNRNQWIYTDEMSIYVRKSKRPLCGELIDFFDLATINVTCPGKGMFTKFINEFMKKYPDLNIYIESVLTARFQNFIYNKLKFKRYYMYEGCFYKLSENER